MLTYQFISHSGTPVNPEARMSGVTASQVLDEVLRGVTVPVRL